MSARTVRTVRPLCGEPERAAERIAAATVALESWTERERRAIARSRASVTTKRSRAAALAAVVRTAGRAEKAARGIIRQWRTFAPGTTWQTCVAAAESYSRAIADVTGEEPRP